MRWQATYKNGKTVIEADGISTDKLNRQKLQSFSIISGRDGAGIPVFTLLPDERGFSGFFYRRRTALEQGSPVRTCHILGWKRGDEMQASFIFEDGPIETRTSFDEAHPWFYSPRFLPHEMVEA